MVRNKNLILLSVKNNFVTAVSWLVLAMLSLSSLGAEFYVSPNGNDDNIGTLSEPFFSLQRARDTIYRGRNRKSENPKVLRPKELNCLQEPTRANTLYPETDK